MASPVLLLLPVLVPLLGGVLLFLHPVWSSRLHRVIPLMALTGNLLAVAAIALCPPGRWGLFSLAPGYPIALAADGLSLLFCGLAAVIFLLAGLYAIPYFHSSRDLARFFRPYLLTLAMLGGIGLSANLLTLILFFEGMTLLSLPLVLYHRTPQAMAAGLRYLFYSIGGAALALVGFFFLQQAAPGADFASGGVGVLVNPELLPVVFLTIVGYGAKAGMFPLHAWLPAAHPVAPAPASAVLSGVITKAGVFAVLRFVFCLVGADALWGTWVQAAWIILALFSILLGSVAASREPLLKRRLAWSSVSQVSYVLLGLATLHPAGLLGALLGVLAHGCAKGAAFLSAGSLIHATDCKTVGELRLLCRSFPRTMGCFALAAASLIGIPPMAGFLTKWLLAGGALGADIGIFRWLAPGVLLLSALLAAGYLLPLVVDAFFPGGEIPAFLPRRELPRLQLLPMAALVLLCLALGLFPGPVERLVSALALL